MLIMLLLSKKNQTSLDIFKLLKIRVKIIMTKIYNMVKGIISQK